jgi:transposase-like protein
MRNVEDKLPEKHRKAIHPRLLEIMHAESRPQAERLIEKLARELNRQYPKAAKCLREDVVRMTAYYDFPKAHWKHLRTTNIIESNFDAVRSRTNVCKRLRTADSATYLVWALLVRRKDHWRRFNGYALLDQVHRALTSKPLALQKAA